MSFAWYVPVVSQVTGLKRELLDRIQKNPVVFGQSFRYTRKRRQLNLLENCLAQLYLSIYCAIYKILVILIKMRALVKPEHQASTS